MSRLQFEDKGLLWSRKRFFKRFCVSCSTKKETNKMKFPVLPTARDKLWMSNGGAQFQLKLNSKELLRHFQTFCCFVEEQKTRVVIVPTIRKKIPSFHKPGCFTPFDHREPVGYRILWREPTWNPDNRVWRDTARQNWKGKDGNFRWNSLDGGCPPRNCHR